MVQQPQGQQWTDQQVHEWQQQQAAQHAHALQQQQTAQPAGQSDLQGAFGSLGVSETQRAEEESQSMDPSKAAELLSGGETETTEPQQEDDSPPDSDPAQEPSESEAEQGQEEPGAEPSMPVVDCAFCSATLTNEDQWSECPECGVYAHAACQEGQIVCARCGCRM